MSNIATIVVTYNRKKLLRECLEALFKQENYKTDIILIDNCSTDGTREYIADILVNDKIKYIKTDKNIGGAGGFNLGIRQAYQLGYDYYWLMDDDSVPDADSLSKLMEADHYLDGNYSYLCSNVRWIDGTACDMNIPEISFSWMNDSECLNRGIIPIEKATFVGFFLNREMIKKVGLPIKEFFIWADDVNYSLRLNHEKKAYFVAKSIIVHKMTVNTGASIIRDNGSRLSRYYYAYRNRLYNYRMIGKQRIYWFDIIKTTILILVRSKYKLKKIFYMYKGALSGLLFNPKIEYLDEN